MSDRKPNLENIARTKANKDRRKAAIASTKIAHPQLKPERGRGVRRAAKAAARDAA